MNTGGKNGGGLGGDDGALHDPVLRRALDHAPDSGAMPDARTRDAIRKMAHNLAPVSSAAPASEDRRATPWWRRLFGGGEAPSRMPWNAAFATVLVATFVTVLWYREPVPDARLDGEAQVGGAAAPAPQEAAPVQSAPQATEPARDTANEELARSRADALRRPAPAPSGKQAATAPDVERKTSKAPPAPVVAASPAAPAPAPAPEPAAVPPPPPAPAAAAAKAMPAPAIAEQSAAEPRAFPRTEDRSTAAPVAAAAPPPMQRERAESAPPALSAQRSANAGPSGALRPVPAPNAATAAAAASPQGDTLPFSALDNWTSLNYVRAGQAVRHARGDVEGLAASVNTVARSATLTGSDLAAPVEARLELYSGTALLAVLEIAGDQVRWTPQSGGRPSVGTPPASAFAALRALLTRQ
ncbi:hypothetical protein [Variovorax paradoxus]|uniref:hypothetical protein n=1 Tax=Variovorax paradoxus TaxID=34073 RepID=UPI003D653FCB